MLVIPLGSDHPSQSRPSVLTVLVCFICIAIHLAMTNEATKLAWAYDPRSLHVGHMFTSAFMHKNASHLIGNLFFFYCFSSSIEREISTPWYLVAFSMFVLATDASYSLMSKDLLPTLGLSGVVWGFMGLFLARFPFQRVNCFVWFLWLFRQVSVPAVVFVLGFLAMDVMAFRQQEPGVNHVAHFSGFVAGLLLIGVWGFMERRVVPGKRQVKRVHGRTSPRPGPLQGEDWR